jgi:hypothetical protein
VSEIQDKFDLEFRKRQLKSLARSYTKACIDRIGGFATSPHSEPSLALEASRILLDRGYGKPKGDKTTRITGADGKSPVTVRIEYPPRDMPVIIDDSANRGIGAASEFQKQKPK